MSYKRGPNIVTDGLILSLDPANVKSFKGDATTNKLTSITNSYGTVDGTYFKSNYGTEIVNIPGIFGDITSVYCNFYNDNAGGSGVCCPQIFNFGNVVATPSTTYTYQIIFKTSTGYYHPNYMYRYEYNTNTYITEGGFVNSSRMTQLGDGWIHAWGTFTTTSTTNRIIPSFFHYEYATQNKIQLAGIMLTQGTIIHEPKFFLPVNGTRGTTVTTGGGLKDLSGNGHHGELINGPIFNSANNGSIVFDGVNDLISVSNPNLLNPGINSFTIDCWVKQNDLGYNGIIEARGNNLHGFLIILNYPNSGQISCFINTIIDAWQNIYSSTNIGFNSTEEWMNVVVSVNRVSEIIKFYNNGKQQGNDVNITSYGTIDPGGGYRYEIGSDLGGPEINAKISIVKHYNRALSSDEILQNYNATKSRFGL